MENLNETIKKILLNIQYDNKMTLKENFNSITLSEARWVGAQSIADVKSVFGELKDVRVTFNLAMAESKILKLIEMDMKNFGKEVEKAIKTDLKNGVPVGTIGPELKELSKVDAIRRITDEAKRTGQVVSPARIDAIKNAVKADNIALTANVKIKPTAPKPNPLQPNPVPVPPPPRKTTWDQFKKWAGYAGLAVVGGAAAYAVWKALSGNGDDKELLDAAKKCGYNSIEEFQAANFKCPKGGNVIQPSKFRNCENETVQTFGCKSSLIRQIQDCLGVVIDGIWGPKTNTALVANAPKFAAGFTKDDIKEICASSSGKIVDKTTEREKIIDPQDVGSASAFSNTGDSSTTGGQSSPTNKSSFTTGGFDPNSMD